MKTIFTFVAAIALSLVTYQMGVDQGTRLVATFIIQNRTLAPCVERLIEEAEEQSR